MGFKPEVSEAIAHGVKLQKWQQPSPDFSRRTCINQVEERTAEESEDNRIEVEPEKETIQENTTVLKRHELDLEHVSMPSHFRLNDEEFLKNWKNSDYEHVSLAGLYLTEELRYEARLEMLKPDALERVIIEKIGDLYEKDGQFNEAIHTKTVLRSCSVGVNGAGKQLYRE